MIVSKQTDGLHLEELQQKLLLVVVPLADLQCMLPATPTWHRWSCAAAATLERTRQSASMSSTVLGLRKEAWV